MKTRRHSSTGSPRNRTLVSLSVVLLCAVSAVAFASECRDYTPSTQFMGRTYPFSLPGVYLGMEPTAVVADGNVAFAAGVPIHVFDPYLYVIDLQTPDDPQIVAILSEPYSRVRDMALGEGLLFAADDNPVGARLRVIDIADPLQPVEIGSLAIATPRCMARDGNVVLLALSGGVIALVDVADPTAPSLLSSVTIGGGFQRDLVVDHPYAYVLDSNGLLTVIDVADPTAPVVAGSSSLGLDSGLAIADDHLFVCGSNRFRIYDLADPVAPSQVSELAISVYGTRSPVVRDGLLFTQTNGSVNIFDVSDPTSPHLRMRTNISANQAFAGLAVTDDLIVSSSGRETGLAEHTGVEVGRRGALQNESGLIAGLAGFRTLMKMRCSGDVVLTVRYYFGSTVPYRLVVQDVSTPTHPVQLGFGELPNNFSSVTGVDGDASRAFISKHDELIALGWSGFLYVITDHLTGLGAIAALWLDGDHLHVARDHHGVDVYDVSDLTNLVPIANYGSHGFGASLRHLVIVGDLAYVSWTNGLDVFDISDLLAPTLVSSTSLESDPLALVVTGSHAYVATRRHQLIVIDLLDVSPTILTEVGLPFGVSDIEVLGPHLYAVSRSQGTSVIDIADPDAPVVIGHIAHGATTNNGEIIVVGDRLWVDAATGVYQVTWHAAQCGAVTSAPVPALPDPTLEIAAYPNPFNPSTNVVFALPSPQSVSVAIYAPNGRLVRTLWTGDLAAGSHALTWDGTDDGGRPVASGMYLARVKASRVASTAKLMMVQ